MLSEKNRAVLLSLLPSTTNSKSNTTRHKREKDLGDGNPNDLVRERIALVDAGRGWAAVQRECVLLKRKG
jgi:hypothetical protein